MGFFSGLKKFYKKIDRKVGGYLPGGEKKGTWIKPSKSSSKSNIRLGKSKTYQTPSDRYSQKNKSKSKKEKRRDDTIYLGGKTPGKTEVDRSISGQLDRLRSGESFKGILQPVIQQVGDPFSTTSKIIDALSMLTATGKVTKGAKGFLSGVKGGSKVGAKTGLTGTLSRTVTNINPGERMLTNAKGRTKWFSTGFRKGQKFVDQRQIIGKVPNKSNIGKLFKIGDKNRASKIKAALRFPANTKTRRLGSSILSKSGFSGKAIIGISAMLGTIPWAVHNTGDAIESLQHNLNRAVEQGDVEGYQEQLAVFEEMTNPDLWDYVGMIVPGLNVALSTLDKARVAILSTESLQRDMDRIQRGEPSQFQKDQLETAGEKNRLFEESQARQNEAELELAKEKSDIFEESKTKQNEAELELAKEKSRIFLEGDAEARRRELQRRIEDEPYYKSITQGKTTSEKSSLTFGLLSTIEKVLQGITEEDVRG